MSKITQNTLLPLGLAITLIGGGSAWMTKVNGDIQNNKDKIADISREQMQQYRRVNDMLASIDRRLSVIEGEVKRIKR